jgi:hypothetical protein
MSRFYGSLAGQARTIATRRGSAKSGTTAHVRGWDVGARVVARPHSLRPDEDTLEVYMTHGSNGEGSDVFLGLVCLKAGKPTFYPANDG